MIDALIVISAIIWIIVFVHITAKQMFLVLIIWLLVSPVASNFFERPGTNPFFNSGGSEEVNQRPGGGYIKAATSVRLREALHPTRLLVSLFFIVVVLRSLLRSVPLRFDKIERLMIVFSIFLIVNVVILANRPVYGLRVAADAFVVPFMGYFLMKRLVITEEHFSQFIKTLGYMGSGVILAAIAERFVNSGITYRLNGPFDGNQVLQVVLAVSFFGNLAHCLKDGDWQARAPALHPLVRWFVIILAPLIVFLTWSRGNWVGFFLGLWTFIFLGRRLMNLQSKIGIITVALFILPLVALLGLVYEPPESVLRRLTNVSTVESRFRTWEAMTPKIGGNQLIAGIGMNNTRDVLFSENNWRILRSTHNSYMTILMELGIFGLITYLAIIGYITKMGFDIYRKRRHAFSSWLGIAVVAIIVAYQLPCLFSNNLHITGLSHVFVYAFAGAIAGLNVQRRSIYRHSVTSVANGTKFQLYKHLA